MTWFSSHLDTVREFVAANPAHGPLLEVDIEDDSTGQVLEKATGIPASCWGKANCVVSCTFWEELDQIKELERVKEERAQRGEPSTVHQEAEGAPGVNDEEGGGARKRATRTVSTLSSLM